MKTKIFYYSLDGNVKLVADGISAELSAENVCLKPVKDFSQKAFPKYFFGGKSVLFKENIPLISYEKNFDFDLILLGTPIWLGTFSSPMRTFLTQNDFSGKKVAIFACTGGGGAEKFFAEFKKLQPNAELISTITLVEPFENSEETSRAVEWAKGLVLGD